MAKSPATGGSKGGGKPGGIAKYFDKALYYFEHPYRAVSSESLILPPSSPQADINDLTASATAPTHRRSYDSRVGGYYKFTKASSQSFELSLDLADDQSKIFVAALVRPRGDGALDSEYLFGGHTTEKALDWRIGTDRILAQTVTSAGSEVAQHAFERSMAGTWVLAMFSYELNVGQKIGINGSWLVTDLFSNTSLAGTGTVDCFIGFSGNAGEYFSGDVAFLGVGTSIPTERQLRHIYWTIATGAELPPPSGHDFPPPGDDPSDGSSLRNMPLLGVG